MIQRIAAAIIAALCFCAPPSQPAYAQKTKAQLSTEIGTTYPDNTTGQITPSGVRAYESDVINSIMPTAPVVSGNLASFNGTTGLLKDSGFSPSTIFGGAAITMAYPNMLQWATNNTSPSHGPFSSGVFDAGNPYLDIGYNINPNNWSLINPFDLAVFFGQEGDYNDGSGHNKMEQYWQMQRQSGQVPVGGVSTYIRTVFAQYDKVTGLPSALNLSSGGTTGIQFLYNDGTGTPDTEQVIGKLKGQLTDTVFNIYNQPGGTNLGFTVNSTASSAATGLQIASQAAGSGVKLSALSSGSSENLYIDSLGASGSVYSGFNSGGPAYFGRALAPGGLPTNKGAIAVLSGQTDAAANGVEWLASSGGSGFGFRMPTVTDGGSNVDLKIQSRQSSASWTDLVLFKGSTGNLVGQKGVLSANPTQGVGYTVGSGSTITQTVSRTSGVTIPNVTGAITLVSAAGSTSFQKFTVTNSTVAATDTIIVNQKSGADRYMIFVTAVGAGSFDVSFATISGTTTEQPVFNFAVIKGSTT